MSVSAKKISGKGSDNFLKISIKDTGVDIAPERLKELFKISKNHSTKGMNGEPGTGFGLIHCNEFVIKSGDEIYINTESEKGSFFFSFTLPNRKTEISFSSHHLQNSFRFNDFICIK